ncbi:MAG: DUF6261 family protein [Capnocytophaga sp.]|nr:DUF6261 family protein [Capnocytophaga sp.]
MIKTTALKNVRVKDYVQVLYNICSFAKQEDLEGLQLKASFDIFQEKVNALNTAIQKETTKSDTREVSEVDAQRSRTFTAITSVIRAYGSSPDEAQANRALKLITEIDKYGKKLIRQSYKAKTTAFRNILTDIQDSEMLKSTINELHITQWVTLLRKQNEDFEKVYNERTKKISEDKIGKSKVARVEAQESFEYFVKAINAFSFVQGEAAYKSLSDKINTEISRALSAIRRKKKTNEAEPVDS